MKKGCSKITETASFFSFELTVRFIYAQLNPELPQDDEPANDPAPDDPAELNADIIFSALLFPHFGQIMSSLFVSEEKTSSSNKWSQLRHLYSNIGINF